MTLALNADWLTAAKRGVQKPLIYMTLDDGGTTWSFYSAKREVGVIIPDDVSIVGIGAVGNSIDPFTREPSVATIEIQLLRTPRVMDIFSSNELNGCRAVLKLGFADVAFGSFVNWLTGVVRDIIPTETTVNIRIDDAYSLLADANITGDFPNRHPLEAIQEILTASGVPSALIDSNSLDPANYSAIGHYVVHRSGFLRSGQNDIRITEAESALQNVADLSSLVNGSLVPTSDGKITFKLYDNSTAQRHWTPDDYWGLKVLQNYTNMVNAYRVDFRLGHYLGAGFFTSSDTDSQSAHSYGAGVDRVVEHVHSTRWLEGVATLTGSTGTGTGTIPSSPTYPYTFTVVSARASGICGSRVDRGSWPMTQPTEAIVNSTRRVLLYAEDGLGKREFFWAEAVAIGNRAGKFSQDLEGNEENDPYRLQITINDAGDRGQFGTSAQSWTSSPAQGYVSISDFTIAYEMGQEKIRRFSNGAPMLELYTTLAQYDLELGDHVTLDCDWYVKKGYNGLDSDTKWEIVGKEVDLGDQPGIRWTLCWSDSVVHPTFTLLPIYDLLKPVDSTWLFQALESSWADRVVRGGEVVASSGLTVDIGAGVFGNGQLAALMEAKNGVAVEASRDTYVWATADGAMLFESVTTGSAVPDTPVGTVPIAKIVAGASTVTSVEDRRDFQVTMKPRSVTSAALDQEAGVGTSLFSNPYFQN